MIGYACLLAVLIALGWSAIALLLGLLVGKGIRIAEEAAERETPVERHEWVA